ncbi:unnamed protein product [Pocillopora meandrina]|uniref:Uncharacterized protein n=1 Tax=Pocillopora meandrina TaxID=46732 RepID=A0AAU9WA80_9CNID|nr:unnamed protein product [Pocillopora meandrina]
MLLYTNGKTRGIVEKGNLGAVARHRDNLQALVKEVDALKLKVEQTMFKAGKSAEDVGSWSSSIEEPIAEADEEVSRLEKWLVETNGEIEHRKHKDEEERKARAREEELKFEREQMEMKLEFERQLEETKAKQQPQGAKFRDREKTFHANETTPTQRGCVYCDATDHRAVNCDKFVTVGDRRKQLGLKQLFDTVLLSANAVLAARSAVEDIIHRFVTNIHRETS